jgi:hypothetical protein
MDQFIMSSTTVATMTRGSNLNPELFGKLGSDFDGERLAALNAIGKQLAAGGLSWNDVAIAVATQLAPPLAPDAEPSWREAVRECLAYPRRLMARDREFLTNMLEAVEPSEKQLAWIFGLQRKVRS